MHKKSLKKPIKRQQLNDGLRCLLALQARMLKHSNGRTSSWSAELEKGIAQIMDATHD